MSWDIGIDLKTGDLFASASNDIAVRTGANVLAQRMHNRLMVRQGDWALDTQFGSRIHDSLRSPMWRAPQEIELAIKEALDPMTDVRIQNIVVTTTDDPRKLRATIDYMPVYDETTSEAQTLTFELPS